MRLRVELLGVDRSGVEDNVTRGVRSGLIG